jgi:hypothetical protein
MRKTSIIILHVTAILISAGAAIASSKSHKPPDPVLYYKEGNNYYRAGDYGIDYDCVIDAASVCTYYYEPAVKQYLPYSTGKYVSVNANKK